MMEAPSRGWRGSRSDAGADGRNGEGDSKGFTEVDHGFSPQTYAACLQSVDGETLDQRRPMGCALAHGPDFRRVCVQYTNDNPKMGLSPTWQVAMIVGAFQLSCR
jgi:hypothetical protein